VTAGIILTLAGTCYAATCENLKCFPPATELKACLDKSPILQDPWIAEKGITGKVGLGLGGECFASDDYEIEVATALRCALRGFGLPNIAKAALMLNFESALVECQNPTQECM
jgi:hypothetical protein